MSAPAKEPETEGVGFIEADQEENNQTAESAQLESSTASINSSILRYREENGRTYHAYKDGKYVLPNDQSEQERLDLQHHLSLHTLDNKLYICPAGRDGGIPLRNVLDLGTGTGAWALDFADENPETQVYGVDLSPIQGPFVPPNVTFQVDDVEDQWTYSIKFDFIYSRHMTSSISDWSRYFEQSYANLTPGGYMEIMDIGAVMCDDGTLKKDGFLSRWVDLFIEGTSKIDRSFLGYQTYYEKMEAAGFTNLKKVVYKWPTNRWPRDPKHKELGSWCYENISSGLQGLSAAVFTRILGWSPEEMNTLLEGVERELRDPSIHAYWPITVVYGQKPRAP
ncbi:unnamed protein product [Clonostachys solani]|uniref:Methyltransferase n=1 Tax=Clonostachys solani TaxID=160281 RepID=A0A9N9ZEN6_9HYPO|nr:unnamed protein product [Clonostachys solani]